MKTFFTTLLIGIAPLLTACAQKENTPPIQTPIQQKYTYETIIDGIDIPWGMAFINSNTLLVTEKAGTLFHVKNKKKTVITGLPTTYVRGQGGLLDVALDPDFEKNKHLFFTMGVNIEGDKGGNTALYRARLVGETHLDSVQLLYKAVPNTKTAQHWGSRIVFDHEGHVYFTIGDRGNREVNPQDISKDGGKVYRLNRDGSIPKDNPFVGKSDAKEAIYSYGHRNPQGMVVHPETKAIWTHEHGPRGGDEINIIGAGNNYGWPKITYGINYSGTTITDDTKMQGMEQPLYYWVPSIAPSGMAFGTDIYPEWHNNLFVGSLKFEYVERLVLKDEKVVQREKVLEGIGRVRNVVTGPDGYLYLGVEGKGILKIIPKS
ncbi:MAG: PQQ-dependent sugar dehydrogenase [Flavobacteriaceae bacterium]